MEEKKKQKYLQTRYKRELERYLNRLVNFVQQEGERSAEQLREYIEKIARKLADVEKVPLHNHYYEMLEAFVEKTKQFMQSGRKSDDIGAEIVHEANIIRKEKRKKSYNRKEKKRDFDDEF